MCCYKRSLAQLGSVQQPNNDRSAVGTAIKQTLRRPQRASAAAAKFSAKPVDPLRRLASFTRQMISSGFER
jgi:hypothetical protein